MLFTCHLPLVELQVLRMKENTWTTYHCCRTSSPEDEREYLDHLPLVELQVLRMKENTWTTYHCCRTSCPEDERECLDHLPLL